MSAPICILKTEETDKLAKATRVDPIIVLTKIASWQGETGKLGELPTIEELKDFLNKLKTPFIPSYNVSFSKDTTLTIVRCDTGDELISSSPDGGENDGKLIKLPSNQITPELLFEYLNKQKRLMLQILNIGISEDKMRAYITTPEDVETFLLFKEISKLRNNDTDSVRDFLYAWGQFTLLIRFSDPDFEETINEGLRETTVSYTPKNKLTPQEYTIRIDNHGKYHIYNRKGEEVYKLNKEGRSPVERRLIFGLLAIKDGRAVLIEDGEDNYLVDTKGKIINMANGKVVEKSGKPSNWREEIIKRAKKEFNPEFKNKEEAASPIKFTTSKEYSYRGRTQENADWSDVTLAFAADFNTAGERATKNAAGKKYVSFELFHLGENAYDGEEILSSIEEAGLPTKDIKLNVAGNGIQTLATKGKTQEQVDELVYQALDKMIKAGITISEIRSGGQTGVDEAAVKAAVKLGIPASVHTTSTWRYRDSSGNDISGEKAFKERFGIRPSSRQANTQSKNNEDSKQIIFGAKLPWTREEVAKDAKTLYIFTDNTDRDSGKTKIDPNSRYAQKYGEDKYFPAVTSAVIRGLDNAFPISTQRWYHEGAKGASGRWTDDDVEEFEKVIKEEIDAIIEEWNTGKYDRIMLPRGGRGKEADSLFNGTISAITTDRVPKIYKVLLREYGRLKTAIGVQENTEKDTSDNNKNVLEKFTYVVNKVNEKQSKKSSDKESEDDKLGVIISAALDALNKLAAEYEATTSGVDLSKRLSDNPVSKVSRDLDPLERRDRVEWLSRLFSRILDGILEDLRNLFEEEVNNALELVKRNKNNKELYRAAQKIYRESKRIQYILSDDVKGRKWCLDNYDNGTSKGLSAVLEDIRAEIEDYLETPEYLYDEVYGEGEGARILEAYKRVLDNFPLLIKEACEKLEFFEGFQVVPEEITITVGDRIHGTSLKDSGDDRTAEEKASEEEQFGDDEDGSKTSTGNDGWGFKIRFVDPKSTLSKEVKKLLNNLEQLDYDGNPVEDDLGNPRYLNGETAHAQLLNELSEMIDSDDFYLPNEDGYDKYPALLKMARKYPYVTAIMDALNENPSLVGALYSDLNLTFISYWTLDANGNPMPLNQTVAKDSAMQGFIRNYELSLPLVKECIYNTGGIIVKENVGLGLEIMQTLLNKEGEFDVDDNEEDVKNLTKVLRMIGLNASEKYLENVFNNLILDAEDGNNDDLHKLFTNIVDILEGAKDEQRLPKGAHLIKTFKDNFSEIARIAGEVSELDNIMSFRDGDKTRYSYSAPNYTINLIKKIKSDNRRKKFLETEFKQCDWFVDKNTGEWLSDWLDLIENNEIVRDKIATKELISYDGIPYSDWTPNLVRSILVNEYFSLGNNTKSKTLFAYYNFPIFADSPVAMFIRMPRYVTDNNKTFKAKLIPKLRKVVKQELIRMKLVEKRREKMNQLIAEGKYALAAAMEILNFDKKGSDFCFFPEFNRLEGFKEEAQRLLDDNNISELERLIDSSLLGIMDQLFSDYIQSIDLKTLKTNFISKGIIEEELSEELNEINTKEKLEEYFWNSTFATSLIIQITTTDLAFYKGSTDFQKRFKLVYASGKRLNTNTTHGRKTEKTIYVKDQTITSSSYLGLKQSLNIGVLEGRLTKEQAKSILSKFKDINVADALAFRNPESFKSILDMMGAWTPDMEKALERFKRGEWDFVDFNIIWLTIKPFMFTNVVKDDGVGGQVRIPHLNKNSEFLVLSMYLMVAAGTRDSLFLMGIGKFFENHPEIDVILFESAVKAGGQGKIDLAHSTKKTVAYKDADGKVEMITRMENYIRKLGLRLLAIEILKREYSDDEKVKKEYNKLSDADIFKMGMDELLETEEVTQKQYNDAFTNIEPTDLEIVEELENAIKDPDAGIYDKDSGVFNHNVVHEFPYSDYMVAQPTPEHLIDVDEATAGSLFRNLCTANLPENFTISIDGKTLTKSEILKLYRAAITDNLLDSYAEIADVFKDIDKLLKKLLQIVRNNPKYGEDLIEALQIVEVVNPLTGVKSRVFNLPLDLPSISNQIQELITSSFKNKVTKLKIKGGNAILVANVGLTRDLNVVRENGTGRVLGVECLLPAYSKSFFDPFLVDVYDDKGNILYSELDIESMPDDLRKIIGYRI